MVHDAKLLRITNLADLRLEGDAAIKENMSRRYHEGMTIGSGLLYRSLHVSHVRQKLSADGQRPHLLCSMDLIIVIIPPHLGAFHCLQLARSQPWMFSNGHAAATSREAVSGCCQRTEYPNPRVPSRRLLLTVVLQVIK